jgi:PAS domain S-box-containing protein
MIFATEMLADIVDSIGHAAVVFHANHILQANAAARHLFGASGVSTQDKPLKFIHRSSRRTALAYFNSLDNQRDAVVLRLSSSDGHPCWGSVIIKPAPYAGQGCYLAIIRDVTREIITPQINYPSIIESIPIGIYRTLYDGTIIYANSALARLLGFENVDELKQYNIGEFYVEQGDRAVAITRWLPTQKIYARDILWKQKNGTPIWIHTAGEIIRDADGTILYMQGSVEDYSEKKQQQTNLQQRNQELEILHQIASSLGTSLDVKQTLHTVLEQMRSIVPFSSGSIFLFHEGSMELLAEMGIPPQAKEKILASLDSFLVMSHLHEYEQKDVIVIADVEQHPDWKPIEGVTHIRSWMGIALRHKNEVIGILNLDHPEVNFYNENHIRYAKTVAGHAAIAIVNAQLYEQARNENERRQEAQNILIQNLINTETLYWILRNLFEAPTVKDVLPNILSMLAAALEQTTLALVIFEPDTGQLLHLLQSDNEVPNIWQVFQSVTNYPQLPERTMPLHDLHRGEGYSFTLPDKRQTFSATIWQRGLIIAIRHEGAVRNFSASEMELLETVANQLTIALENEDKTRQLENKSEHLERLVERRTQQLSIEKKRQEAILDATAEGIFYMENFRIQYANPAFCRMVGYPLEDLYGKPLSFVRVTPEAPDKPNFNDLLDDKIEIEPGRSETKLRHKDGTEFYASLRFSLIGQPGNDMLRMVAIARDISQERELYFQRARFIANAAHELRTPLSSLMLRMHMMKRQPEKITHHLESLDHVTNFLKHLVEELVDLSRFERGTIALDRDRAVLQDLIQQAADTYAPFAEEQNITIHLFHPDEAIPVFVDRNRIVQMLGNLIVNGINYNKPGGEVTVKTLIEEDYIGNRSVIIEVIDNGLGIAPELLPGQIFEPFSRPSEGTRRETGMGLALCREIVHLHNGTIHARSTRGEGSVFRVLLPID